MNTDSKTVKKPWPTKAVMKQIYEKHLWGGNQFDFYSGEGSHKTEIVKPYLEALTYFLESKNNTLTVCDLGCGDFNIGKHLVKHTKKYFAIDIVESLVQRNKSMFKTENLDFSCMDISKDSLPMADCIILRQVLQHLSNTEIKQILNKISGYKYIILTEHLPSGDFIANTDKISGQGIRLKQNSGVDILAKPFSLKVISAQILDEFIVGDEKGKIVTTVFELPQWFISFKTHK